MEKGRYSAVQVGFGERKEKHTNRPMKGHFDKAGVSFKKHIKEFRLDNAEEFEVGNEIGADVFAAAYFSQGIRSIFHSFLQAMITNEYKIPVITVNAPEMVTVGSGSFLTV